MNPPNRVYNAHILHSTDNGWYWLDEHEDESRISEYPHIIYYKTKTDACKAAIDYARAHEYASIVLRGGLIAPRLRHLSDENFKVTIVRGKGRAMDTGWTITIWLPDEVATMLKELIALNKDEVSRSPTANVISKLIIKEYKNIINK